MQKTGKKHRLLQVLILLLCLIAGQEANAQGKAIVVDVKNEPLPKVLRMIEKSSDYKFMFSNDDLNQYRVTKRIQSADINVVMKDLLNGLPLSYSVKEKFVYIVNSGTMPAARVSAGSQTGSRMIRGRVTDSNGEPLPGVTIKTDDPTVLGVTDENGSYTILIPGNKQVKRVTYSMLGMAEQTLPFNGKTMDVTMHDNAEQLGEVVVTGLFNYRSASFTGSAQTYSNEELKSVGNANLLKSLATLDPAFVIADNTLNGSNPNAFNEITIHGNSSFAGLQGEYTGNPNEPLFIIDGFESSRQQVFDLDMNRVKSVTILKDAAAKAIYGSKAANGVVVVETIEPESGRLRVTYTGDLNLETPDLTTYDLCNAEEKLAVELASGRYNGTSPYYQQMLREQYNEVQKGIARGVDTYWLAKPLRTGVGQKHTLYFEGGDDRMRYSATAAYNGIAGVMKGSDRRTFSGNVKLQYRYKNLLFRNSLSITSNKADDSPYGSFSSYASANPYFSPTDENGNMRKILGSYTAAGYGATPLVYYNPLYNAEIGTKNFSKYTEYTENFYIEWRPLDYLRFTGRLGYTYQTNKREDFYPGDHSRFSDWTGDNFFKRGEYSITDGESSTISTDLTANFSKQWDKHMLLANAAWSLNSTTSDTHGMTAWGFTNSHVDHIAFAKQYADNGRPSGSEAKTRSLGITGALNYSYDDRYLADFSLRYNGSSVFGSNNRWGTFWSAGLGWNVHNEAFMKNQKVITLLKIRGSYGLTGSQNFSPYQALATYKYYDDIVYDNITGAYLMALANPDLKWQQTADLNYGFDLQMFRRLNVRLDVYNSITKNALLAMTVPTSTGFSSYQENLGEVQNRGFDLSLNYRIWQKKDNFFSVFASVSHNKNKVRKINDALKAFNDTQDAEASTLPIIRYEEGQSMTAIWAVQSLGIDPATGTELFLKKDGVTKTYNYTTDDYIIAGDSNPKYRGNFGFNGEYRGFGLSCTFTYRTGADYYNQTLVNRVENVNIAHNVDRRVFSETWQQVGDVAKYKHISSYPSTTYATTRFVEREHVLDFASLSAYYDFKHCHWLRKLKMERLRLQFYMNDVFHASTIKAERGLDYPYAHTFAFSLSATF